GAPPATPEATTAESWQILAPYCQVPGRSEHALIKRYAWADVFVEIAAAESPLKLLDVQQLGCIPLASHTPASEELIGVGRTGFLLRRDRDWIDNVLSRLEQLQRDRGLLVSLGRQAAGHARARGWAQNGRG